MYRWMPLWDIEVFILCPFPLPFKLTLGSPQGMAIVLDASQEVSCLLYTSDAADE